MLTQTEKTRSKDLCQYLYDKADKNTLLEVFKDLHQIMSKLPGRMLESLHPIHLQKGLYHQGSELLAKEMFHSTASSSKRPMDNLHPVMHLKDPAGIVLQRSSYL
ncbi:MAG: hypothetical protein K2Y01_07710 [Rhabdochlamydiaceae bacterium]|nr:hypothetical protein [Rhabdochlamydiaceae bacterium]